MKSERVAAGFETYRRVYEREEEPTAHPGKLLGVAK
jgi:hypothetical protein